MYCIKCGKEIDDGTKFCSACGASQNPEIKEENKATEGNSNYKFLILVGCVFVVILAAVAIMGTKLFNQKNNTESVANEDLTTTENGDTTSTIPSNNETALNEHYFSEPVSVHDHVQFGYFEQDGDTSNGMEPISWHIIGLKDGYFLMVSDQILFGAPWTESIEEKVGELSHKQSLTYEDASVRNILNEFASVAFGEEELKYLQPVSVSKDLITLMAGNQYAQDYAFLPDYQMLDEIYGADGKNSACDTTKYARSFKATNDYYVMNRRGGTEYDVLYKDIMGKLCYTENPTEVKGIRPAIYINMQASPEWDYTVSDDVVDRIQPYLGVWMHDKYMYAETPDYTLSKGGPGIGYFIEVNEKYFDISPFTKNSNHQFPLSEFVFEKSVDGYDSFVSKSGEVRIMFVPNYMDGERDLALLVQLIGTGPDGWGTWAGFARDEDIKKHDN